MFSNLIIQGSWRYYLGVSSNEQQRYHMGMVSAIPFVYLIQYVTAADQKLSKTSRQASHISLVYTISCYWQS